MIQPRSRGILASVILLLTSTLVACGGGGSSGGGSPGGNSPSGGGSKGTFTVSPKSSNLTAEYQIGSSLPELGIAGRITGVSPDVVYLLVTITGNAIRTVSHIEVSGPNAGALWLVPGSQYELTPGVYQSSVTIVACTSGPECVSGRIGTPQTIDVTLTITGVGASVSQLAYDIGDDTPPSGFSRTFTVAGPATVGWTATSDVSWLQLSSASGSTSSPTSLTATLTPSDIQELANGQYKGVVRLRPAVGSEFDVPVTLNVDRSRVNYVSPYVAQSGTAGDVIIRGERLTRYPPTGVRFGTVDAVSFTVVDETQIRARHPALAAGNYPVQILNGSGFDQSRATLRVVEPPNYARAALPYPVTGYTTPFCLLYDAERRVLIAGMSPNADSLRSRHLVRYSLDNDWAVVGDRLMPDSGACALTPDGTRLLVPGSAPLGESSFPVSFMDELDPVSLQSIRRTYDAERHGGDIGSIAMSNTGAAIFTYLYDGLVTHAFSPLRPEIVEPAFIDSTLRTFRGTTGASQDGSSVFVGNGYPGSGLYRFDAKSGRFESTTVNSEVWHIAQNRNGSFIVLNQSEIRDANLALLGVLPGSTRGVALDPVLPRVYTIDTSQFLRRFDLAAPVVGGVFQEILPAVPVSEIDATYGFGYMIATPDGRAVIIAGHDGIVLIPLP